MSQPTREEVKTFILALRYGMKVTHKPEFLIAMAEGWLESNCEHPSFIAVSDTLKECAECKREFSRD